MQGSGPDDHDGLHQGSGKPITAGPSAVHLGSDSES
jgi:hypothetical protein